LSAPISLEIFSMSRLQVLEGLLVELGDAM
jgi:hypothetical protein